MLGTYVEGKICPLGDKDYYTFTIPTDIAQLRLDLYDLPKNYDLRLYDDMGIEIRSSVNGCLAREFMTVNNPVGGKYFLGISSNGYYDGLDNYRLHYSTMKYGGSGIKEPFVPEPPSTERFIQSFSSFSVYPNPADKQLSVVISPNKLDLKLSVVDTYGVVVKQENIPSLSTQWNIKTGDLVSGVYIIEISSIKSIYRQKILVLH